MQLASHDLYARELKDVPLDTPCFVSYGSCRDSGRSTGMEAREQPTNSMNGCLKFGYQSRRERVVARNVKTQIIFAKSGSFSRVDYCLMGGRKSVSDV